MKKFDIVFDKDQEYKLLKTGAKNPSEYYPDKGLIKHGYPSIEEDHFGKRIRIDRGFGYFLTSAIVSIKKDGNDYLIETENSYYVLSKSEEN